MDGPEIPFNREDAFFPLRRNPATGHIVPSYFWRECKRRIIFCVKWEHKKVYFENQEWFYQNSFGLSKRKGPGK